MVLAADYPFLDVFWTLIIFFVWVAWFMLLFHVIGDIFRRTDASGWKKTAWLVFMIFVPFLGVFAYLIVDGDDMAKRNIERAQAAQADADQYIRTVAGSDGAAAEIERAKALLDSGAISQAEFDSLKGKALA